MYDILVPGKIVGASELVMLITVENPENWLPTVPFAFTMVGEIGIELNLVIDIPFL